MAGWIKKTRLIYMMPTRDTPSESEEMEKDTNANRNQNKALVSTFVSDTIHFKMTVIIHK